MRLLRLLLVHRLVLFGDWIVWFLVVRTFLLLFLGKPLIELSSSWNSAPPNELLLLLLLLSHSLWSARVVARHVEVRVGDVPPWRRLAMGATRGGGWNQQET